MSRARPLRAEGGGWERPKRALPKRVLMDQRLEMTPQAIRSPELPAGSLV